MFPKSILALLLTTVLVSSIGFKNYIWFISLGYGFSIAAESAVMLVLFRESLTVGTVLCCILFLIYGCRLGGYLAYRESKSTSYRTNMVGEIKDGRTVPFGVKCAVWLTCATLYATQVTPVFYRLVNGTGTGVMCYVGAAVMACGILFESAADLQKNESKKKNPRRFVDTGLYRIVRCPNYFGEVLFWTGVFLSGFGALQGGQWILAVIGYLGILYVMFSGARRLEIRQNKNYGKDPAYQRYIKTVPILIPFLHLYSVEKYKWLVA